MSVHLTAPSFPLGAERCGGSEESGGLLRLSTVSLTKTDLCGPGGATPVLQRCQPSRTVSR
eukprot:2021967-Alexandrium_andersonii.AAC.1